MNRKMDGGETSRMEETTGRGNIRSNVMGALPRAEFMHAYDAYANGLFLHCYYRVYDRERAKDFVQETFMRTWEYINRGNIIQNLRAFLYRVANNLIIDDAKKKKAVSLDELQEKGFDPGSTEHLQLHTVLDAKRALAVIHDLDEKHRQLILLRYVDGFGPKEIAEVLGESENVISVRLHRAMKHLRQLLTPIQGADHG